MLATSDGPLEFLQRASTTWHQQGPRTWFRPLTHQKGVVLLILDLGKDYPSSMLEVETVYLRWMVGVESES